MPVTYDLAWLEEDQDGAGIIHERHRTPKTYQAACAMARRVSKFPPKKRAEISVYEPEIFLKGRARAASDLSFILTASKRARMAAKPKAPCRSL